MAVSAPEGSAGGVRLSVTGRTSIVGKGPVETRPGAVVDGTVDACGRMEGDGVGAGRAVVTGVARGALEGGNGTNDSVVLVGGAVVGARDVGALVAGGIAVRAGAVGVVGVGIVAVGEVGTGLIGSAAGGGARGTKGKFPVGRPGVVGTLGGTAGGAVVVDGAAVGAPTVLGVTPGAEITSPSGGTMTGGVELLDDFVVGGPAVVVAVSDRDFRFGFVVGVSVAGGATEAMLVSTVDGAGTNSPSGGTIVGMSDSRKSGSGRASGTVTLEANPWASGFARNESCSFASPMRAGPATGVDGFGLGTLRLGRAGPATGAFVPKVPAGLRSASESGCSATSLGGAGVARV